MKAHSVQPDGFYTYQVLFMHLSNFTAYDFEDRLPRAQGQPLFYVAIYGIIGLASLLTSTISMGVNSTGALRGSRLLETPTGDSCASNNALTRRHANWPDAHLFQSMLTFADECNLI